MDLQKTYLIGVPPEDVWRALTDVDVIDAWGGGPAVMSTEPGAEFSLWGGDIHGTIVEAVAPRRLVQEWWGGDDWEAPSLVTFVLEPAGGDTLLKLKHTGVPDGVAPDFEDGWDEYYLEPLRDLLEEGCPG
jgi:uncharacterized protein YndB with AHSA1/START domain